MDQHPQQQQTILVVDDQPDIRELLDAVLQIKGFSVTKAPGGPDALVLLQQGLVPDLILLDVQMPEMDGWEALAQIREQYGDDGPRVVMCTVKGHPRDLIHGWAVGCDGYIWKPFDMTLLVDEINLVLARPHTERAHVRRSAIGEAQILLRSIS